MQLFSLKQQQTTFKLTIFIGQGRGYQSWKKLPGVPQLMDQRFFEEFETNQTNSKSVTFPIDAIFMPIKQVNFSVQEHSVDGEYVYFEVWTNGSIHPFDAMKSAAKVCMKLMTACLTKFTDERAYIEESQMQKLQILFKLITIKLNQKQILMKLLLNNLNCHYVLIIA